MTTNMNRADALTVALRRARAELEIVEWENDPPARVVDLFSTINVLLAAPPVEQHATTLTANAALAAIETFEIVGENNDSREPNTNDRFILTEYVAHLFGGYPVEQPGATLTAEEVAALHVLNETLRYVDDMGPADEGWQSDKLNAAWTAVDAVLARAPFGSETGHARADARHALTDAARDVLAERRRQIEQEGWTPAHDDQYRDHELPCAAGCYAMYTLAYPAGDPPPAWPWVADWWKPTTHRRNLVKAGALIQAAIERLDRTGVPQ